MKCRCHRTDGFACVYYLYYPNLHCIDDVREHKNDIKTYGVVGGWW